MQALKAAGPETRSNGSRQKEVVIAGSGDREPDRFF
jgi:hypothetical protein